MTECCYSYMILCGDLQLLGPIKVTVGTSGSDVDLKHEARQRLHVSIG